MDPALISALASAPANIASGIVNPFLQSASNRSQRKWMEGMYDRQRNDAIADWNMMNDYNSPTAQMDRLKDAKLNPNLVYGNGATAQASSPVRSSSTGSYTPTAPRLDMSGYQNSIASIYDLKLKDAQTDNLQVAKRVQEQDILLKAAQTQKTLQDTHTSEFDLKMKNDLKYINIDMANQALDKARAESTIAIGDAVVNDMTLNARIDKAKGEATKALNEAEASKHQERRVLQEIDNLRKNGNLLDFKTNLERLGVNSSDPTWVRILSQLFGKYVPSP